jgi:hypothetical protein
MHTTTHPAREIVKVGKGHGLGNQQGSQTMTQDELKRLVRYNPETGAFIRLVSTGKGARVGDIAGSVDPKSGYVQLWVGRQHFRAHRLAWFYMTGEWPSLVDHINGDRSDNRWANLRQATKSQNAANQRPKKDRALPKGVYRYPYQYGGRPFAQIRVENVVMTLGVYDSVEEAQAAYAAAALLHFGVFACLEPSTTIPSGSTPKRAEVAGSHENG